MKSPGGGILLRVAFLLSQVLIASCLLPSSVTPRENPVREAQAAAPGDINCQRFLSDGDTGSSVEPPDPRPRSKRPVDAGTIPSPPRMVSVCFSSRPHFSLQSNITKKNNFKMP